MTTITALEDAAAWAEVLAAPGKQWVFKHSNSCSISFAADDAVKAHLAAHADQPLAMVVVQTARPVSNQIAEDLGRVHKSPQLFLIEAGKVLWEATHWSITAPKMQEAWAAAGA
jgi:bacillithiol system protein YtxJ